MHYRIATLHTMGVTAHARIQAKLRSAPDRGSVTLEQVIIGLGLFLIAIAVVAGITAAINSRLSQIT